uniref:Uncharacterized protein n=1 Tax=Arundo donax TaxID=35708 RepID=A0A0A9F6M6_ARUDO
MVPPGSILLSVTSINMFWLCNDFHE